MERIAETKRIRFGRYLIFWFYVFAVLFVGGCSSSSPERLNDEQILGDLSDYLTEEFGQTVSFSRWEQTERAEGHPLSEDVISYQVDFQVGDVSFHRSYTMTYRYSKAFGWSFESCVPRDEESWSKENAGVLDAERILSDLEDATYYTSYSDGMLEEKRILSSEILEREYDIDVGYDRISLQVVLNAENVHENVMIDCEYLLNEEYRWELFAHDMELTSVNVQAGVTEDGLVEALKSLKFYREEEDGTWWIGELDKLSYEILSRNLDKEASTEEIEIAFRGEDTYMFLSGTAILEFHFSSGWYLYDSEIQEDACETGMLSDTWIVDESVLTDTLVQTQTFAYGTLVDYPIGQDSVSDMRITGTKTEEKGLYQTAYFTYNLRIRDTVFRMEGYGKYAIQDGILTLNIWNNNVTQVTFDLSGVWYACDMAEDYLAYYTLNLKDSTLGTLEGQLTVYGVDLTGKEPEMFSSTCAVLGNVSAGIEYELFVESWTVSSDQRIGIPAGTYDFFQDMLIDQNGHTGPISFTKEAPTDRLSRNVLSEAVRAGVVDELLESRSQNRPQRNDEDR